MEQSKHDFYSSAKINFPALIDNDNFKSVKNMIINEACNISYVCQYIATEPDNIELSPAYFKPNHIEEPVSEPDIYTHSEKSITKEISKVIPKLLINMSNIIYDDYMNEKKKLSSKADRKLRMIINRKKQELGLKQDMNI